MKKTTKWVLPLSLLMTVGVYSGALDASAKTITQDTAKQTSMSDCDWQTAQQQAYEWVKSYQNQNSPVQFKVVKVSTNDINNFEKLYSEHYGSNQATKPTTGSNQAAKPTTGTTQAAKPTTGSSQAAKPTTGTTQAAKPTTGSNQATKPTTGSNQSTKPATGSNTSTSANSNSSSVSQFEQKVIELTNAERAKAGLKALQADTKLMQSARLKSDDMAKNNYFDHTSPTYGSPFDQMKSLGISYKSAGENIAQGQRTPEEVVQAWMDSPGHRANIMNSSYTHIGVGYSANGNYWTQQFIGK
ncbi:CAP domain-containing protein [Rummeliibacillus sp. JY-2-4R]